MIKATEKGVDLIEQGSGESVAELQQGMFSGRFILDGYNAKIPSKGESDHWFDCHYCGNATQNKPGRCIKCNCSSFEARGIKKKIA